MRISTPFALIVSVLLICQCSTETGEKPKTPFVLKYPSTKKIPVNDVYFGDTVVDHYRWLEDDNSAETAAWVKEQNTLTFGYLETLEKRSQFVDQITELNDYQKRGLPFKKGKHTYYFKNNGLQNQSVLYRLLPEGGEEVFLDPNTFSEDGTTALTGIHFSHSGDILAYQYSEGGSDWGKIAVMDTRTKEVLSDHLEHIKFSSVAWLGDAGFYYSTYPTPDGNLLSAITEKHILYFHTIGTDQTVDLPIFGHNDENYRYLRASITEDQKYLAVSAANTTSGNQLFLRALDYKMDLVPLVDHMNNDHYIVHSKGTTLFALTNLDAPTKRLVSFDISKPQVEHWKDVIPQKDEVLSVEPVGDYFLAEYMKDALSHIEQYSYSGEYIRTLELPGLGSASLGNGKAGDSILYYSFSNYHTPTSIYTLDLKSGVSTEYWTPSIAFDPTKFSSKQVFFKSSDGTQVPMIITHKKDLVLDGKRPTIVYGYGGFNISLTPSFSASRAVWMENGGVYAVANLRGGGEYGRSWHEQGTKLKKQQVFDDCIAAIRYVQQNGYSSPATTAIQGGSNGGLLAAAILTQFPEEIAVSLPAVGVLDMLRYHEFTAGAGWAKDYGRADESREMYTYLKSYSPYHNVEQRAYPATLITTADHDDRVVPAHSFKFAAELQAKQQGKNPVLIRIETNAGHGAGKSLKKAIQESADVFAFAMEHMNQK